MFNQRVVTAAVLAPLFLAAVYLLDTPWFSLIMAAVMCPAAWEWSRLAGLQGRLVRLLYLWLFLVLFLLCYHFRDSSWSHIVVSHIVVMVASIGWMLVLLTLVFCGKVFLAVDHLSHSVSDTVYGVFPYIVPSLMLLNWVASKTCAPEREP